MHFFRSRGIPVDGAQNWGPILAQTECQFLAPVTWPAQLLLAADVIKVGKSSMTMRYAVFIETETEPRCVAMGSGVIVLINYQSGDKLHIDDALRDRLLGSSPPRAEVR